MPKLVRADGITSVVIEKLKGCPVEGVGDAQPAFKFMQFFKGYETEKVGLKNIKALLHSDVLITVDNINMD